MKNYQDERPIVGLDGCSVRDYYNWAHRDLLMNTERGVLAEFIVAKLLGVDMNKPREEWAEVDLEYQAVGIEVKSTAYVQSWEQKKHSAIRFDIAPKGSKAYKAQQLRKADLYIMCLYITKNKDTVQQDILNLTNWQFYVLTRVRLEALFGNQRTVGLNRLATAVAVANHNELPDRVNEVIAQPSSR